MNTTTASAKLVQSLRTKRVSLKKQYLNELEHDKQWFKDLLARKDRSHFWVHGDLLSRVRIQSMLKLIEQELNKIALDNKYKPWKD